MKVILLRDIAKLGKKNSIVEVAQTYALNVLIPKGDAKMATDAVINQIKQAQLAKDYKKEKAQSTFLQMIEKLHTTPIIISGKKHQNGSLFAHISEHDIADAIYQSAHFSINPKQIHIEGTIKHHGTYSVVLEEAGKKATVTVLVKE